MSLITRVGTYPLISQLFTTSFTFSTATNEEPAVGDVVMLKSDGTVKKSDADFSIAAIGVVIAKNSTVATVLLSGIARVISNGAINVGAVVGSSLNGRVKAIPTAGATYAPGDVENAKAIIGKALTSATGAGEAIIVALHVV